LLTQNNGNKLPWSWEKAPGAAESRITIQLVPAEVRVANIKNNASAQETRRKLIDAAGQVFAERGLHAATIKEITDLAGVNTAAINYHFSDKYELYAAVIRHALTQTPGVPAKEAFRGSPEQRLKQFISHVIRDLWDPSRPAWWATLIAHELSQPTPGIVAVMDELLLPRVKFVRSLIRDILGPRASDEKVSRGTFSVTAQCFHYLHSGGLLRRIEPELTREEHAEKLAAHIAEFSLAGLKAMSSSRKDRTRQ
jgi:AcrR family transcriptional regulator